MRVECMVEEVELTTDTHNVIEGVRAECGRCHHSTESYGTSEASVKRCLVLLREECPEGESNFYVAEDA